MIVFNDDKYIVGVMDSIDEEDFNTSFDHLTCYTLDDYKTHFICVIITHDYIGVGYTYAANFAAKRKLLILMKKLHKFFNRRIVVGKDSNMFNKYKKPIDEDLDEIILKGDTWVQ